MGSLIILGIMVSLTYIIGLGLLALPNHLKQQIRTKLNEL